MLRLLALVAVIATAATLHAEPMRPGVDRAKYIVHLKVASIEKTEAVCDVEDILLGMVAGDRSGRVRVIPVDKLAVGDEFTLVAPSCTMGRYGMVFDTGTRTAGEPAKRLRELIYERVQAAQSLAAELEKLLPGATAEVEKALDEFEKQARDDFKDISANADLLLDLVATGRYTPDVADLPRPTLDDKTRARHTRLTLRALCELSADGAEIAAGLVEGEGNGTYALLQSAAVDATEGLRKLAERGELEGFAAHVLRYDVEKRALAWFCKLAPEIGPTAELAQWAVVEAVEGSWVMFADAEPLLAPERSTTLPYDNAAQRALANALSRGAIRLAAWLVMRQGSTLTPSDKVAAAAGVVDGHRKQAAELYGLTEMLQVYAYALAVQGADAQHVKDAREQIAAKRSDKLDLADIGEVEWELKKKNKLPDAVRRVVKVHKGDRR